MRMTLERRPGTARPARRGRRPRRTPAPSRRSPAAGGGTPQLPLRARGAARRCAGPGRTPCPARPSAAEMRMSRSSLPRNVTLIFVPAGMAPRASSRPGTSLRGHPPKRSLRSPRAPIIACSRVRWMPRSGPSVDSGEALLCASPTTIPMAIGTCKRQFVGVPPGGIPALGLPHRAQVGSVYRGRRGRASSAFAGCP